MTATDEEFTFNGVDSLGYQEFLQQVRRTAFNKGKSQDFAWMAALAALHFSGDALKWYERLDDDTQKDWNLLRKAVVDKYGSEPDEEPADEANPEDLLLPARIEIAIWTAPILASSLRFPRTEDEWMDEARERKAKFSGNAKVVYWHLVETGDPLPRNAIPTGNEHGKKLFSVRVWKNGGLTVGKQVRAGLCWNNTRAWIPWYGIEVPWSGPFEILVGDPSAVRWVSPRDAGRFHAVEGGFEIGREQALFIAQFNHLGQLEPGKVFSADGQGHFGGWLFEFHNHDFRVLAWA